MHGVHIPKTIGSTFPALRKKFSRVLLTFLIKTILKLVAKLFLRFFFHFQGKIFEYSIEVLHVKHA